MSAPSSWAAAGGYLVGPTVPAHESPWPCGWERAARTDDGHAHEWESVLLAADGRHRVHVDEVIRCRVCHAPRCDGRSMVNPCMQRRHHHGPHLHLDGQLAPLGARASTLARGAR